MVEVAWLMHRQDFIFIQHCFHKISSSIFTISGENSKNFTSLCRRKNFFCFDRAKLLHGGWAMRWGRFLIEGQMSTWMTSKWPQLKVVKSQKAFCIWFDLIFKNTWNICWSFFLLNWKVMDSYIVHFFWRLDLIENTYWDLAAFKPNHPDSSCALCKKVFCRIYVFFFFLLINLFAKLTPSFFCFSIKVG